MDKLQYEILTKSFDAFLKLYSIAYRVFYVVYKIFIKPILFVLYQLSKLLPEVKPDYTKSEDKFVHKAVNFVDTKIFKIKPLESEIWTAKWEAAGCPIGGLKTKDNV